MAVPEATLGVCEPALSIAGGSPWRGGSVANEASGVGGRLVRVTEQAPSSTLKVNPRWLQRHRIASRREPDILEPGHVHHILHKIEAGTASAWPGRSDVVVGSNRFCPPHLTVRSSPEGMRRWRYSTYESSVLERQFPDQDRLCS